jgi:aminopeptidase N
VPAGEPVPDAVVLNDGDLTYAELALDPATLDALAAAAMDVGDPLTEAVCWNAVWRMMTTGSLAGGDFAGLVTRRLGVSAPLPVAGVEVLLERAVTAADRYSPDAERAGLRAALAAASLAGASAGGAGSPRQRALATGFAASASSDGQLAALRSWLSGGPRPDGLELDGNLRGGVLRTLAARGLATEEDLDALAADPVGGAQNLLTCRALRPDAAAKAAAWETALEEGQDPRMAEAAARGIWVPGQETVLAGYRERYFAEALPALDGRDVRTMRRLARALYPATLAEPATLAATAAALERGGLSDGLRLVLQEQQVILRAVLAARSVPRRWE